MCIEHSLIPNFHIYIIVKSTQKNSDGDLTPSLFFMFVIPHSSRYNVRTRKGMILLAH